MDFDLSRLDRVEISCVALANILRLVCSKPEASMVIKLRCSEGHRVTCPDDKAGHTGRCPKCGSSFQVPDTRPTDETRPDLKGAEKEDTIVFLCPNGHKLNGPSSLQGTPGQCPHCNMRFVIPDFDNLDEETYDAGDTDSDLWDEDDEDIVEAVDAIEPLPEDASGVSRGNWAPTYPTAGPPSAQADHPMAAVFDRFWGYKRRGSLLKLHLKTGETIVPENYASDLSRGPYAVFTVIDKAENRTLTMIAWDTIARVAVKDIGDLPGFFPRS